MKLKLFFCFYLIKVYSTSIGAACQLDWPKDRILVQVLDDSDDGNLQMLINDEVASWKEKGVNIVYRHRLIRTGYKAGNLKSAMSCDYVKDYEFVAIFDADFQPNPDFLKLTVPHFKVGTLSLIRSWQKFSLYVLIAYLDQLINQQKQF